MLNLVHNVAVRKCLGPKVETTTPETGSTVDTLGYGRCEAVLACGTQAGTSNTFKLEESDNDSTWGDVADADLLGGTGTIVVTTSNDIKHHTREYIGAKRYVRWNFSASSSGNIPVDCFFILSQKRHAPTSEEAAG